MCVNIIGNDTVGKHKHNSTTSIVMNDTFKKYSIGCCHDEITGTYQEKDFKKSCSTYIQVTVACMYRNVVLLVFSIMEV